MYSELWGHEDRFSDLLTILKNNRAYAGSPSMGQVYAAYMNYNHKGDRFNTPGVLLTDAVMFALGASHLELGDHMLCHEYFPNDQMKMTNCARPLSATTTSSRLIRICCAKAERNLWPTSLRGRPV